jgi:hypothetical protein
VQSEDEEEEEAEYAATGHGAKTSETSTAAPIASSSSSTTHSMNQRLFTGNSIGRIRPLTKPREEEVRQVSAAGRAKHLMAPGAVDPVSRIGADQAHTSSVADKNDKGGKKLVLLSKHQHGATTGTSRPISDAHAVESNWDDDNSPPRFTHDPDNNDVNPPSKSSGNLGGALLMSYLELVDLLRRPPKSTLILRTKSNFQQFFRGVDRCRMHSLLARAYEDIADASERSLKIKKRMGLLDDGDA